MKRQIAVFFLADNRILRTKNNNSTLYSNLRLGHFHTGTCGATVSASAFNHASQSQSHRSTLLI